MSLIDRIVFWDYQTLLFLNGWMKSAPQFDFLFKFLAVGLVYLVPAILIIGYLYSSHDKKIIIMSALAGLFSWRVIGKLTSAFYFRERPFTNTIIDLKEIVFHRPTYSFPSDHAIFFASIFLIFWLYGYRKLAVFILIIGLTNSLMRIMVGLHYPLDILAGWMLGLAVAGIFFWQRKFLERYLARPIEKAIYKIIRR
jgi:undecaprenyl-diphosphatase